MMMTKRALPLISHTSLGNSGGSTGFYYNETAAPCWTIRDLGWAVTLASVAGGPGFPDSKILVEPDKRPQNVARFMDNTLAMDALQTTAKAAEIPDSDCNCVFLPGDHDAIWDLNTNLIGDIITDACAAGAIIDTVCHGPSRLLQAKETSGDPLTHNKRGNSLTNRETEQIELVGVEPLLLDTRLREAGTLFEDSDNFTSRAVKNGRLITGQDPQRPPAACRFHKESLEES